MLSERMLKKWRMETLQYKTVKVASYSEKYVQKLLDRILQMTQELLDIHLLRKK